MPLDQRGLPTTRSGDAVRVHTRRNFREKRLQLTRVPFPPKIDITALDLCDERSRRHRAHSFGLMSSIRPAPHRSVSEKQIASDVRILRIKPADLLIGLERLVPFSLPPFDRRDQPTRFAVVRRALQCAVELLKGHVVILLEPVATLTEREMRLG